MSLRVWLPLVRDLNNQGLADITVTNSGATLDSNGKLGGCYAFNGSNAYVKGTYEATTDISFCCWVYFTSLQRGHVIDARKSGETGYQPFYINRASIQCGNSTNGFPTFRYSWVANTWYNVIVVHNSNYCTLYVNGTQVGQSTAGRGADFGTCEFNLGCRYSLTSFTNVKLNDFRIYDHALSAKEVKELSKGLVAHYKLDDSYITTDTTVYDCSGYNYHGTKTGDLTVISDTSRYSLSTHFDGTSYSYLTSISSEIVSISLWVKWDSIPSGQSVVFMDYKSRIGFGLMSTGILCGSVSGPYYTFSKSSIVANTWYHFVIVSPSGATNTARKLYINGVEQTATSNTSNWSYGIDQLQIGRRSTTSDGFVGKISDFRAYSTVLSADDIKELYQTSASIDKDGNFYAYELKEVE